MISYIGGKSRMAKWISGYIPDDIETYIEVFGGAFWVYVNGDVHMRPGPKWALGPYGTQAHGARARHWNIPGNVGMSQKILE